MLDETKADVSPETSGEKQSGGRFKPGKSGNPKGRPRGSRNKATRLAEQLLDSQVEALVQRAVSLALGGDTTAIRLCLERVLPPRKDRPVQINLPKIETSGDIAAAQTAILERVAIGDLTPAEGQAVADLIEGCRRAFETRELEARISALEGRK